MEQLGLSHNVQDVYIGQTALEISLALCGKADYTRWPCKSTQKNAYNYQDTYTVGSTGGVFIIPVVKSGTKLTVHLHT